MNATMTWLSVLRLFRRQRQRPAARKADRLVQLALERFEGQGLGADDGAAPIHFIGPAELHAKRSADPDLDGQDRIGREGNGRLSHALFLDLDSLAWRK